MLVEMRTYTLAPGAASEYLALYRAQGLVAQQRHLGAPLACYQSEVGHLNQLVFLWGYEHAADRAARRANLLADAEFLAYFQRVRHLIVSQHSALMNPVALQAPAMQGLK